MNLIRELHTSNGILTSHFDITNDVIAFHENLFNFCNIPNYYDSFIPPGKILSPHLATLLTTPILDEEIKVVFSLSKNSTSRPDDFTFEFFTGKSREIFAQPSNISSIPRTCRLLSKPLQLCLYQNLHMHAISHISDPPPLAIAFLNLFC